MVDLEKYGGKRGYLEHLRARALYSLGAFGHTRRFDWVTVQRLVFVCKGNICRSPYAAEKARELGVPAISFGLEAKEGAPAEAAAIRNAARRGVDLSQHRSSPYDDRRVQATDLVVVFEPQQLGEVRRRFGGRRLIVTLLGIWSKPCTPYIHDPYGWSDDSFERCYAAIDSHVLEIVHRLRTGTARRCAAPSRPRGNSEGKS